MKKLIALIILDGFGLNDKEGGNAVFMAKKPNFDKYWNTYPHTKIMGSGEYVGLPKNQMGNSEVGHLNIGAGRVVYQNLLRISKAIENGKFYNNPVLNKAMDEATKNNSALHLMGLVSDGGVHSHNSHLYALLKMAKDKRLSKVFVHCFLDGRDTPPTSGAGYVKELQQKMQELGIGKIASISGRYYAMDRDKRWERIQKSYDALLLGEGNRETDAIEAIEKSYLQDINDEFVLPTVMVENDEPVATIKENDSVIFFNFRPDRARQLTRTLTENDFSEINRPSGYFKTNFITMTNYDETLKNVHIAYEDKEIINTLGEYLSKLGKKQLRIAETEKYAHVTYFFSGGREKVFEGEDRALIASPKVATYDLKPEMSAYEVTAEALKRIDSGILDIIILNFANCDMVGHSGIIPAAVKAVETVDNCLGVIIEKILENGGQALITADHGNAEQMIDYETGQPHTAHTTNPVPLILISDKYKDATLKENGCLADLAPTLLKLMDLKKPEEMTGRNLINE
ncbi:MAG: 2,3-bisphosphoglycerate-independent phosphoglycerate mutase [candidate division CPR2 bacterium GW2011_GWC1_39_9]|uniref:2,3-bisphosphoglycerate-independent phosphoglycerate mutase n=1 Tax=candidate division CPR2 bacterium GW2011_GWC2_39_10 TaxID=1618345 RepID=A0A0G0LRJ6_UNCC2|nr:MAG: 2,3-bisphosphoglycerate-independent phosphoglycerate mutase [candidate division CPR2 bacterium GW2011_GWC2_39_10]KKR34182.1 MAG: 2,3-bisphosphoglycerate-independent phosphoglycerate mutase [candidate division CPR2 bacterium GW2011_GWC1_39_9]